MPDLQTVAPGKSIEEVYLEALWRMAPAERFGHVCDMHRFAVNMLTHQIHQHNPVMADEEIRFEVLERMFLSDPRARVLIARARETNLGRTH